MIFNHNLFFLGGFFFYIVIPLVFVEWIEIEVFSMIPKLNERALTYVFIFMFLTLFFWFLGQNLKVRYFGFNRKLNTKNQYKVSVLILFFVLAAVFSLGISYYGIKTGGYSDIDFKYSGFVSFFSYAFAIVLFFSWRSPLLIVLSGMFYLFSCLLLLLVGSRLYVLSSFLAILVFYTSFSFEPRKIRHIVALSFFIFFLVIIGVIRSTDISNLSFSRVFFVIGAEPFFTWWSVALFPFDAIGVLLPEIRGFASLFINLIPSSILPNKADYIVSQAVLGGYQAPLGASNVIVSSLVFFGLPLWCLCILIISTFLSFLARNAQYFFLARCIYATYCSFMPFLFFREIYQIQVKLMVTFLFLIPCTLLLMSWGLRCLKKKQM